MFIGFMDVAKIPADKLDKKQDQAKKTEAPSTLPGL
jgi:hypothetical protein